MFLARKHTGKRAITLDNESTSKKIKLDSMLEKCLKEETDSNRGNSDNEEAESLVVTADVHVNEKLEESLTENEQACQVQDETTKKDGIAEKENDKSAISQF